MTEQSRPPFRYVPLAADRPQRRQLVAGKPGAHREVRIVDRDVVTADEAEHAAPRQRNSCPARLASNERARAARCEGEEIPDLRGLEVMEEKVCDERVERAGLAAEPFEHVGRFDAHLTTGAATS